MARDYLTTRQRDAVGSRSLAPRGSTPSEGRAVTPKQFDETFLNSFADASSVTIGSPQTQSQFDSSAFPSRKSRAATMLTRQQVGGRLPIETLNFDLVWDDSTSMYGNVYELQLQYRLLDDLVDISYKDAKKGTANGKYSSLSIVKRQKLPRQVEHSAPLQGTDSQMRMSTDTFADRDGIMQSRQQYRELSEPGSFIHWSGRLVRC